MIAWLMFLKALAAAGAMAAPLSASMVSLAPSSTGDGGVGIVWFGRSDIATAAYDNLFNVLGREAANATAIVPAGRDPQEAVSQLRTQAGATRIVVMSHSMEVDAGIAAQRFVDSRGAALHVDSLVLISGFLQRRFQPGLAACAQKAKVNKPKVSIKHPLGFMEDGVDSCSSLATGVEFPVPVLTIGGELDGLVRVGRFAEAAHIQQQQSELPVVVIEGMAHSSVLSAGVDVPGDVPASVATLSREDAMKQVAAVIVAFLFGGDLSVALSSTTVVLAPFIAAFQLEGSWWFTQHVDEEHGASAWAAKAQRYMADPLPSGWRWQPNVSPTLSSSTNEFHLLSDEEKIPPYYRGKHRASVEIASVADQTLRSHTIAQLRYVEVTVAQTEIGLNGKVIIKEEKAHVLENGGFLDSKDTGKEYVSAIEIATKMASRQKIFNITSDGIPAPDSLDDGDRCARINKLAYEWALSQVSPAQRKRHEIFGVPMRMVADKTPTPNGGPWFIWSYLKQTLNNGTMDVQAWTSFTSTSGLAYGEGTHYCKNLSPARAMEYIVTDSLKYKPE